LDVKTYVDDFGITRIKKFEKSMYGEYVNFDGYFNHIFILLPSGISGYKIDKFFEVDFDKLKNKTFLEITKSQIPIIQVSKEDKEITLYLHFGINNKDICEFFKYVLIGNFKEGDILKDDYENDCKFAYFIKTGKISCRLLNWPNDRGSHAYGISLLKKLEVHKEDFEMFNYVYKLKDYFLVKINKIQKIEYFYDSITKRFQDFILLEDIESIKDFEFFLNYFYEEDEETQNYLNEIRLHEIICYNPKKILYHIFEKIEIEIENNKNLLPDIYLTWGFEELPTKYILSNIHNDSYDYKGCSFGGVISFILAIFDLLLNNNTFIYFLYLVVCFCGQVIAPMFFIIDTFRENIVNCPNDVSYANKFFAIIFFIIMHSQMADSRTDLFLIFKRFNVTYLGKTIFPMLSLFINMFVILMIPIFTFAIFMKNNEISDLILNCLTGLFLAQLDDLMVTFSSDKENFQYYIHDHIFITFLKYGLKNKNKYFRTKRIKLMIDITKFIEKAEIIFLAVMLSKCL